MKNEPAVFKVALFFILVNALIWLVFAILTSANLLPLGNIPIALRWILAVLSLIASAALFVLYRYLKKRNRLVYYLSLVALFGLIVLTFTDEVGLVDLVYLVIALTPFVLLIVSRHWYFRKEAQ